MAARDEPFSELLIKEFEKWQEETSSEAIFLLEPSSNDDGSVTLNMLLGSEREFKLRCPLGYPDHEEHFYVEADPVVTLWANALNEFLLDSPNRLSLTQVLHKAVSLFTNDKRKRDSDDYSEDDMSVEDEEEDDNGDMILSDDDSAFTTEWELKVARKKKRWAQKEEQVREEMKKARLGPGTSDFGAIQASGQEKEQAKQIFTSSAASGILTNDLVKIMESEKAIGFTADPIDDNIYQWCVKLFDFDPTSDIAADLSQIQEHFGYKYIELQLDFTIDLYPFYPPLVKVIRPRLQASLMQRVTNMEMLKLSYWNPAKDMMNVLVDIKSFLEHWARLEVLSERNDMKRFPYGSYVDIEHHLLRLALVSEVNPRANIKYQINVEKAPETKPHKAATATKECDGKKHKDEYWAAGTGYGHSRRPEWDVKAYIAAQKEKDKQIEAVLLKILMELKLLYKKHAPQLKPRTVPPPKPPSAECIDPVEDMYNIIEGSALIPFLEQYLKADSFLEICRHTSVYKLIVDIIKEIAMQPQLLPLIGTLSDQNQSIYEYLQALEAKASLLLQHVCKAGNGSIPKPPTKETKHKKGKKDKEKKEKEKEKEKDAFVAAAAAADAKVDPGPAGEPGPHGSDSKMSPSNILAAAKSAERTAEEKLARDFHVLFRDVTEAFNRLGMPPVKEISPSSTVTEAEVMDITLSTDEEAALEAKYKKLLHDSLFASHDIELEGSNAHHYYNEFKKAPNPNQAQVFRIAQELTSLSSSLPLELSSSIFVRTDDDKLVLMKALITGPEGTPYGGGCYLFDIFFPSTYPKTPPLVNLQTTGGGTVRFNPNLYNCGKVCLSLLGTWEGQQGERWNETTSTVLQVLVSIQSLILVPEPYFNEPGYEQEIGTDAGKKHSFEYNCDVRLNNIKYAMIAQLQNPSPGFEDVIKTHFFLKKDRILEEADNWANQGPNNSQAKNSRLERAVQNLRTELNKLQPPPNLANLSSSAVPTPQQTPKI